MAPSTGGSLHRAFHRAESSASSTPALSPAASSVDLAMGRTDTTKSYLDIVLDAPFLTLRGTGPDVEATSLSGHVALFLTESTSIKEITLQFRGKAKIPMPASESTTSITYVVCNHDWSFLEGDKRHSRTLKAGRHFFPFHLEIGGTLPSSIHTPALGGASVAYKLRALAVRPGLAHNLHAIAPVHIVRSFTHEALEYQQTLEIENTWPEKLMYSIMLPHKAWPAGDSILAVLKLAPLSKGVVVMSIVTSLHESTRVYARSGAQEDTRVVASVRHDIIDGAAVEIDAPPQRAGAVHSIPSAAVNPNATSASSRPDSAHGQHEDDGENNDIVTFIRLQIPPSSAAAPSTPPAPSTPGIVGPLVPVPGTFGWPDPVFANPPTTPGAPGEAYFGSGHAPTHAHHNTPALGSAAYILASTGGVQTLVTPTHALEPIAVAHRVRWSIFLKNRDGHSSELRCSLPVVILDGRVRAEARAMSAPTRRLMLGSVGLGAAAAAAAAGDDEGAGFVFRPAMLLGPDGVVEEGDEEEEEAARELPSYTAHVRDRVANMFLPEAVTMRVTNPWLGRLAQAQAQQQHEHELINSASTTSNASAPADDEAIVTASLPIHSQSTASMSTTYSAPRTASHHSSTPGTPGTPGTPPIPGPFPPVSNANSSPIPGAHHLPPVPASGARTPLDWVNSELLLSLSDAPLRRLGLVTDPPAFPSSSISSSLPTASSLPTSGSLPTGLGSPDPTPSPHTLSAHATIIAAGMRTPPVAPQYVAAPGALASAVAGGGRWGAATSRGPSRGGSRAGSRAASPERGVGTGGEAGSRGGSRPASRPGSRAGSPVRGMSAGGGVGVLGYGYEPPPVPSSAPTLAGTAHEPTSAHAIAGRDAHGHGHGVRNLQSLFKATMKPFTALAHHHHHHTSSSSSSTHAHERDAPGNAYERDHHGLSVDDGPLGPRPHPLDTRRSGHPAFAALAHMSHHPGAARTQSTSALPDTQTAGSSASSLPSALATSASGTSSPGPGAPYTHNAPLSAPLNASFSSPATPLTSPSTASLQAILAQPPDIAGPALLHRALTAVPDYAVAARGFIGGVPPLSSMHGLPSYAEAEAQRASGGTGVRADSWDREERERQDREEEEEEEEEEERGIEMRRAPR